MGGRRHSHIVVKFYVSTIACLLHRLRYLDPDPYIQDYKLKYCSAVNTWDTSRDVTRILTYTGYRK